MSMYKFIGVIGLVAIIVGIVLKNRQQRNMVYIVGGIALTIYSVWIGDWIFILLQVVFTGVALFDLIRHKK